VRAVLPSFVLAGVACKKSSRASDVLLSPGNRARAFLPQVSVSVRRWALRLGQHQHRGTRNTREVDVKPAARRITVFGVSGEELSASCNGFSSSLCST
jgi:hypothetical protein